MTDQHPDTHDVVAAALAAQHPDPDACTCLPPPFTWGPERDCPVHGEPDDVHAADAWADADEHDDAHPVWVEGCDGCTDRAAWIEAQRVTKPPGLGSDAP